MNVVCCKIRNESFSLMWKCMMIDVVVLHLYIYIRWCVNIILPCAVSFFAFALFTSDLTVCFDMVFGVVFHKKSCTHILNCVFVRLLFSFHQSPHLLLINHFHGLSFIFRIPVCILVRGFHYIHLHLDIFRLLTILVTARLESFFPRFFLHFFSCFFFFLVWCGFVWWHNLLNNLFQYFQFVCLFVVVIVVWPLAKYFKWKTHIYFQNFVIHSKKSCFLKCNLSEQTKKNTKICHFNLILIDQITSEWIKYWVKLKTEAKSSKTHLPCFFVLLIGNGYLKQ